MEKNRKNNIRIYYGKRFFLYIDKQGRIRIPEKMLGFAKIKTEVIVCGVGYYMKIYAKEYGKSFS
jgi:DNA-binding transcriptional regulator/RsmH inhibitor MraZ